MFDWEVHLDELRCHTTDWLRSRLDGVVAEQRALKVEELAIRRILDERGQVDLNEEILRGAHNEAPRTARQNIEVARQLESLPAIAAAAHAGTLSWDQLKPLVEIATPDTTPGGPNERRGTPPPTSNASPASTRPSPTPTPTPDEKPATGGSSPGPARG